VKAARGRRSISKPEKIPAIPHTGPNQTAITPQSRRQKTTTPPFIAKRHKTVRTFFDVF